MQVGTSVVKLLLVDVLPLLAWNIFSAGTVTDRKLLFKEEWHPGVMQELAIIIVKIIRI